MAIQRMYYDNFTDEYVDETELCSPPERYIETMSGSNGIYIEHWKGYTDKIADARLSIAYNENEYYDSKLHKLNFDYMCSKNNFTPKQLYLFIIPKYKFDEYAKRFGIKEKV